MIAFSFDDGPAYDYKNSNSTERILDVLEKYNARATFFMVGERVNSETKHLLDREIQNGCELGNHTYAHNHYGSQVTARDISRASKQIEKISGRAPTMFRCPGGIMEHLKKEWNEISPEIKTGSPVIDVILMEKLREAKEKQIRFISDFHYPGDTKLNAFDLSVILNNALDNCMENVSGENPYICISSFRKNSIFMITIKNRYEGELNYKDSDLPETTKSGKEHGIGLHNIRRVARMYMGDISLEQENQEVVLSIMLQVE